MAVNKTKTVSLAQYRMLMRALRGEYLPCSRFHGMTVRALERKGCFVRDQASVAHVASHSHATRGHVWRPTDLGREMVARKGILRPDRPMELSA